MGLVLKLVAHITKRHAQFALGTVSARSVHHSIS
jgi:hypothetical protein